MKTLFDDQLLDELKAEVERRRCPKCGAPIFIHNLQDFTTFIEEMRRGNFGVVGVYCSDMGHWAGYLHECWPQTKEDEELTLMKAEIRIEKLGHRISAEMGTTSWSAG
ncbi:MAG: hypothetical protein Q8K86_00270 [Candidatus Nanopelagicaceae bacterium]|nr:hypothetical protein [Candidatus Nanopelagicaceae bacterium]